MNIRRQQSLLALGSAAAGLVLATSAALVLSRLGDRAVELGASSTANRAVEELSHESGELLVALDLLMVEQSNAFVIAEMLSRGCEQRLQSVIDADVFDPDLLERLRRNLGRIEEHAGRAAVSEPTDPARDVALEAFYRSSGEFVADLGALEEAAAELRVANRASLARIRVQGFAAIGAVFAVFLLAVYLLRRWSSRQLVEPLFELERGAALAVEEGQPLRVEERGPRELVSLTRTLSTFAGSLEAKVAERTEALALEVAARRRAEEELQELNRDLEQRVEERTRELSESSASLAREILERERAERERTSLEAQLQQSQKMEAIGRLAGGISHDFNNLLMVIEGYVSLMRADHDGDAKLQEPLRHVMEATSRATALTRQLLAFSRKQAARPRVVDIDDLLDGLRPMLSRLIGEHIVLEVKRGEERSLVHVDPIHIEQVVMNLAVNARDAMPEGGVLRIATRSVLHAPQVDLAGGAFVEMSVSDDGSGIDPGIVDRIFEPFFTTKDQGEGTGLGLSTVYGIVRQCGGEVRVESALGEGTRFAVLLPRSDGVETAVDDDGGAGPAEHPGRTGETILVVEDEGSLRQLLVRVLSRQGYEVLEAENGADGLELARSHLGSIDLVITDVVMPRLGGPEFVRELRRIRPSLKAIFTSGYPEGLRTKLDRGTFFLEKPFEIGRLHAEVRQALRA